MLLNYSRFRVVQRVLGLLVAGLVVLSAELPRALHAQTPKPGTDGTVDALVVDGSGMLYVGGQFTMAGGVPANNIARWDGTSWTPLDAGSVVYLPLVER